MDVDEAKLLFADICRGVNIAHSELDTHRLVEQSPFSEKEMAVRWVMQESNKYKPISFDYVVRENER